MHQIYRRAKAVIVWLSPEDDDSDLAMAAVDKLSKVLPSLSVMPFETTCQNMAFPLRTI
jgi:hypothetical protein